MSDETKNCPFCGETINIDAKKCKHCGEWLEEKTAEEPATVKCPYCGEDILSTAVKCKHCGEWLKKEVSSQNKSQGFEDDPLLKVKTFSNGAMILVAILLGVAWQPAWLYQPSKTDKNKRSFQYINEIKECIPAFLPITMALVNLFAAIFLIMTSSSFCLLLLIINTLILSILEIKCMSYIEKHVQKRYDVQIGYSKFWTFILQSIYMNYFFLTYKERINKAKSWR